MLHVTHRKRQKGLVNVDGTIRFCIALKSYNISNYLLNTHKAAQHKKQ